MDLKQTWKRNKVGGKGKCGELFGGIVGEGILLGWEVCA